MGRRKLIALMSAASAAPAAARQAPAETATLFEQGERALAGGRYAEAQRSYRAVADARARDGPKCTRGSGLIYFQQGKFADAVPALRRALAAEAGVCPNLDALLAMSLSELGRHQEAVAGLEQAFRQPAADRPCGGWSACTCSGPTPTSSATATPSPSRSS